MPAEPALVAPAGFEALRARFDETIAGFLRTKRAELADLHPETAGLADELLRLVSAGGKRLRPAFCYWGYRATGGRDDERIVRAACSLELFHTFALIHDDLMDRTSERRGVRTSRPHLQALAEQAGTPADAERFGLSAAILAGDLVAVWADEMLLTSGFAPDALVRALVCVQEVRQQMGAGQYLDVSGAAAREPGTARLAAALKGAAYTVSGPLAVGAELAGADPAALGALSSFGEPLGEAFQLADDVVDADAGHGATAETVNRLVDESVAALDRAGLEPAAAEALRALAESVRI